jgi:hypothetical protein
MLLLKLRELIYDNPAKRDKVIIINLILCLLADIALWALLLFKFWNFGEYIILDYNIYFGISLLGPWYQVLIMPLLGLLVIAIDFLLSFYMYLKNLLISRSLAFTALGINLILLVAGLFLMFVN